jgi:hypothetical protein
METTNYNPHTQFGVTSHINELDAQREISTSDYFAAQHEQELREINQVTIYSSQDNLNDDIGRMYAVSIADVLTNPEPPHPFTWGPYLPEKALTLLTGHGGTGKSGFGTQIAVHVSMGLDFLGLPVKRSKTLFFSAEDAASILRIRIADICRNHDINPVDLSQNLHVMDATDASLLWESDGHKGSGLTTFNYSALSKYIAKNQIEFLVVDNASDTFGADRFDKNSVTRFVRALVKLVAARSGGALLLAHVNRSTVAPVAGRKVAGESYSDSVAWHNAARSRLFLSGEDDGEELTLLHEKSNYGKRGATLTLSRMQGCGLEVVRDMSFGITEQAHQNINQARLSVIIGMIDEFYKRGEWISTEHNSRSNAFKLLGSEKKRFPKGLTSADLWELLRDGERSGLLEREAYRSPNRKELMRWWVINAPSAPSARGVNFPEPNALSTGSAPCAPTGIGGMGEGAHAPQGAPHEQILTKSEHQQTELSATLDLEVTSSAGASKPISLIGAQQ